MEDFDRYIEDYNDDMIALKEAILDIIPFTNAGEEAKEILLDTLYDIW